jgi:hypothetical protein
VVRLSEYPHHAPIRAVWGCIQSERESFSRANIGKSWVRGQMPEAAGWSWIDLLQLKKGTIGNLSRKAVRSAKNERPLAVEIS